MISDLQKLNQEIINALEISKKLIPQSGYESQRPDLVQREKLVNKNGIYLRLPEIEHTILIAGYPNQFLSVYINLLRLIISSDNTVFKEFAFRTLIDMSFEHAIILFSSKISTRSKLRFIVYSILNDYFYLSSNNPTYMKFFKKTATDYKHIQSSTDIELISSFINKNASREDLDKQLSYRLIKIKSKLIKKIKRLDFYDNEIKYDKFINLKSPYSTLLHGDIIFLEEVTSKDRPQSRVELRSQWIGALSGFYVLSVISTEFGDFELNNTHKDLKEQIKNMAQKINQYWLLNMNNQIK